MKHLILAVVIGLTTIGCVRYEQGENIIKSDDIYYGTIINSNCGDILLVTKINNKDIPQDRIIYGIKLNNLSNNPQTNNGVEVKLYNLKEIDITHCGGFLAYNYEAYIENITIKNQ